MRSGKVWIGKVLNVEVWKGEVGGRLVLSGMAVGALA